MKDFGLTRQNRQQAKVHAECACCRRLKLYAMWNCIMHYEQRGNSLRIAQSYMYIGTVIGQSVSMIINLNCIYAMTSAMTSAMTLAICMNGALATVYKRAEPQGAILLGSHLVTGDFVCSLDRGCAGLQLNSQAQHETRGPVRSYSVCNVCFKTVKSVCLFCIFYHSNFFIFHLQCSKLGIVSVSKYTFHFLVLAAVVEKLSTLNWAVPR